RGRVRQEVDCVDQYVTVVVWRRGRIRIRPWMNLQDLGEIRRRDVVSGEEIQCVHAQRRWHGAVGPQAANGNRITTGGKTLDGDLREVDVPNYISKVVHRGVQLHAEVQHHLVVIMVDGIRRLPAVGAARRR